MGQDIEGVQVSLFSGCVSVDIACSGSVDLIFTVVEIRNFSLEIINLGVEVRDFSSESSNITRNDTESCSLGLKVGISLTDDSIEVGLFLNPFGVELRSSVDNVVEGFINKGNYFIDFSTGGQVKFNS